VPSLADCLVTVEDVQLAFVEPGGLLLQKEIRQWLDSMSAEQDAPVLWDDEKTPSK